jgi:hypothetical protein
MSLLTSAQVAQGPWAPHLLLMSTEELLLLPMEVVATALLVALARHAWDTVSVCC